MTKAILHTLSVLFFLIICFPGISHAGRSCPTNLGVWHFDTKDHHAPHIQLNTKDGKVFKWDAVTLQGAAELTAGLMDNMIQSGCAQQWLSWVRNHPEFEHLRHKFIVKILEEAGCKNWKRLLGNKKLLGSLARAAIREIRIPIAVLVAMIATPAWAMSPADEREPFAEFVFKETSPVPWDLVGDIGAIMGELYDRWFAAQWIKMRYKHYDKYCIDLIMSAPEDKKIDCVCKLAEEYLPATSWWCIWENRPAVTYEQCTYILMELKLRGEIEEDCPECKAGNMMGLDDN